MKDLFVNFIGAIVFNVIGFFYIIGRNIKQNKFINNLVPTKIREQEEKDD
jgi:hypothetical protein